MKIVQSTNQSPQIKEDLFSYIGRTKMKRNKKRKARKHTEKDVKLNSSIAAFFSP